MNPPSPFDEEHDPKLEVVLNDNVVEVRGVERLSSIEEFKENLKNLSPEQIVEMLQHMGNKTPPRTD